jgi:hypothetical protein
MTARHRPDPARNPPPGPRPDLTVLVPVAERPDPLDVIYSENARALEEAGIDVEFVFVVEPAYRELAAPLHSLQARGASLRVIELGQTAGETALLKVAAQEARAPVVLTLPAYRRVVASGLPDVVWALHDDETDLVVARRWPRADSWLNRIQNRAYHFLLRPLGEGRMNDVACGVRAMPRELLVNLPLYGDFHRFLPFIAAREGYRVREVEVPQHPADRRARVYSPATYLHRIIDLVGIFFLLRFTERPLRFFGLLGTGAAFAGVVILAVTAVQRYQGVALADRPVLLLGVLLVVLGMQAVALGLVGEIIVHLSAPGRTPYRVRKASATDRRDAPPTSGGAADGGGRDSRTMEPAARIAGEGRGVDERGASESGEGAATDGG